MADKKPLLIRSASELVLTKIHQKDSTVSHLSSQERVKILQVIERDLILQHQNFLRVSRLKNELTWLRKKGAVKTSQDDAPQKSCGRCQTSFGLLINRGAVCTSCRQKVCKQCREDTLPGKEWVCTVCRKQIEIQLATGEWINEFQRPVKRKEKTEAQSIPKRQKVKRSWTIHSPFSSNKDSDRRWRQSQSVPSKPPRKRSQDENEPPWNRSPERPPRRYSMSSVDMPLRGRSPVRDKSSVPSENTKPTKYYFFGDDSKSNNRRSSTLPRPPRTVSEKKKESHDVARFHSMPRTRHKPPDVSRASEVSRAPPEGSRAPNDGSRATEIIRSPIEVSRTPPVKAFVVPSPKNPIVSSVMNEPSPSFRKRMLPDPIEARPSRRLPETPRRPEPHESKTRGPTNHPDSIPRPKIPRSNTSISSGFATTGRPSKATENRTPIRRTQSFQSGSNVSQKNGETKGSVAKFVQELERGIHMTCSNMTNKSRDWPEKATEKRDSTSCLPHPKRLHQEPTDDSSRKSSHTSENSVHLDPTRIVPESNDYKLVFISSDSSKDSGTSLDSTPVRPLYENIDFQPIKKPKGIDIGLMTEGDYSDSDTSMDYPNDGISIQSTSRMSSLSEYTDAQEHIIPVTKLNDFQMQKILEQTKNVEEEAQALQKALMGVFDPRSRSYVPEILQGQTIPAPAMFRNPIKKESAPLYENLPCKGLLKSNNNKVNVCTQTDFSPLSSDTDDSYTSFEDSNEYYDSSTSLGNKSVLTNENNKINIAKSSSAYSTQTSRPLNISTPPAHLQITSERSKASVLLSPVREVGALSSLFGKEQSVRAPRVIYHNVIRYCEEKSACSDLLSVVNKKTNLKSFPFANSQPCETQTASSKASIKPINPWPRNVVQPVPLNKENPRKMASEVNSDIPGDVNALNKVICVSPVASGSSDEDTDEDAHVSRSYDVSTPKDASEKIIDRIPIPSDSNPGSSESCSETDEEKSVSGQYEVTAVRDNDTSSDEETKADLPECDQAIDRPNYTNDKTIDTTSDTDNAESVIENKSETESTLGIDNDDIIRSISSDLCIDTSSPTPTEDKVSEDESMTDTLEGKVSESEESVDSDIVSESVPEPLNPVTTVESSTEIDKCVESDPEVNVIAECLTEAKAKVNDSEDVPEVNNCSEGVATQITETTEVEQAVNCNIQSVLKECASASDDLSAFCVESIDESGVSDAKAVDPVIDNQSTSNCELEVCDETSGLQEQSTVIKPIGESECKASDDTLENIDHNAKPPATPGGVAMGTSSVDSITELDQTTNQQEPPVPPTRKIKVSTETDCENKQLDDNIDSVDKVNDVESDTPSSNDSLLQGDEGESHCSEGSEEGNLISIVAVGDPTPKKQSQGKIYICSDSTDSDVQVRSTCIVVTGSSGVESEGETESESCRDDSKDVTVFGVSRNKDHVMSMRVTSPESSRSTSPSRSKNGELQSMILSNPDVKHSYRSGHDQNESSSLATYFTVTLGSESPVGHKRASKTPEVRRRSIPDRGEKSGSHSSTPTQGETPSPVTSPAITPSPIPFETDSSLNDDEKHETSLKDDDISFDELYEEGNQFNSYSDGMSLDEDGDQCQLEYHDDGESNFSETSSEEGYEREEEIRYCKRAYNFTLHTIIEESCEESDSDKKQPEEKPNNQSELEKYFFFGLGNGPAEPKKFANEESEYSDTFSETSSSIFSEGLDSIDNPEDEVDPAELASSRLEKYFSGFLGFERQPSIRSVGEESATPSDESDSVGSDSEGSPSPEQPRKKLFRTRGVRSVSSSRSHGYSSDKGEGILSDGSHHSAETEDNEKSLVSAEEASTESEQIAFEKSDGQFDTIKRRKKKKNLLESPDRKPDSDKIDVKLLSSEKELEEDKTRRLEQTPPKESTIKRPLNEEDMIKGESVDSPSKSSTESFPGNDLAGRKYQSRDSGFIGSSDDLLKDKPEDPKEETIVKSSDPKCELQDKESSKENPEVTEPTEEFKVKDGKVSRSSTGSSADLPMYIPKGGPRSSNLSRKDSFNNWSSDEETNIMMNKMRMYFKNMFSSANNGKETGKGRMKSPQLLVFEARLTSLMRTVPGLKDDQVKEIVEYLSAEETWSDSYDSSDHNNSEYEDGNILNGPQTEVQKQISVSCQEIIENFNQWNSPRDIDTHHLLFERKPPSESSEDFGSKDSEVIYNRILSSFSNMKPDSDRGSIGSGSQGTSPPLLTKVMHHIGNRIFDLMHEVSVSSETGDDADSFNGGLITSSPRPKLFLPTKYKGPDSVSFDSSIDKSSLNSTSFESEDSPTDSEQSPKSPDGTPKILRHGRLSIISEKSSSEELYDGYSRSPFASQISPNYPYKADPQPHSYSSQRSLEERTSHSHPDREPKYLSHEDNRFTSREHQPSSRFTKSGKRTEARKAKSHMSLEKIHQEDVKNTGERSESLGDLNILDRGRSSGFSSSYEQLDSDSTLRASDSYDRHIGSSSSNIRLNASSRGSLTTSSRGSLAASSRGSLNAGSKGSLHGSSGPDDDDDKKSKKISFFRHSRRPSATDDKDSSSREVRSTTLPRSNPIQLMATGTLPRSQATSQPKSPTSLFSSAPIYHSERPNSTAPRSARYHPPGYRPPTTTIPKRTISTPSLRKDRPWHTSDDTSQSNDDHSFSAGSHHNVSALSGSLRGGVTSNESSRAASPLGGSLGRTSGGSLASFDNDDEGKRRRGSDRRNASLSTLGPKSRSDSLASVYSTGGDGRYGSVAISGELRIALQYNYKEGQLECNILQGRDLSAIDTKRNRSDPYVKAYLLPDRSKLGKRKTKVKKHTLNPTFDEVLKFTTTLSDLENRTLWLSVWNSDYFSRNDFLGEILIPLSDHVLEDSQPRWYTLQDKSDTIEESNYGAFLIVALKFVPPDSLALAGITGSRRTRRSRGALQVRIKEANGLVGIKQPQHPPDPVCKGVLLPEKGKSSKQKTSVCRKTSNPQWNHTMVFGDVTLQELTDRGLELSIWDHDRFGGSEFLGGCRLNLGPCKPADFMDASGLEQKLWEQMIERPNLWVESSILLRSSMDRSKYNSTYLD